MNRLVTGLERENFQLYDNNVPQTIKTFSTEDAPLSIGIVFDLSGSMQSKFLRARKALSEFLRTCNPKGRVFRRRLQRPAGRARRLHLRRR